MKPLNILSLGAGVQSSTLALMAARGEIGPMPDCAIFSDTQAEPPSVYKWLDYLEAELPFPVYRVTAGSLRNESLEFKRSNSDNKGQYIRNVVPAFTIDSDGNKGMLLRKCTADFKVAPIIKKTRELIGLKPRQRAPKGKVLVVSWIGISTDEAMRQKPSRLPYIEHRWPLIEMGMTRGHCLEWMEKHGYPVPPRSACTFCPYHKDEEWLRLKNDEPEAFQDAVEFEREWNEKAAQDTRPAQIRGQIYLHRDCKPLDQVNFVTPESEGQVDMFNDECEGMCGV